MKNLLVILAMIATSLLYGREISGTVTDPSGDPVYGATVQIKNSKISTTTDFDGKYSINASPENMLVFIYTGYDLKEIMVGDMSIIDVQLSSSLEEIVIQGYANPRDAKLSKASNPALIQADVEYDVSYELQQYAPGAVVNVHSRLLKSNNEEYAEIKENTFKNARSTPLSTFSIDVDKAAYSNIRRMINNSEQIPTDAVKIEEMINYFSYNYKDPIGLDPLAVHTQVIDCPWNSKTKLARIAMKGKDLPASELPPSNLTFLIDVSGSMSSYNKLPLVKETLELLVKQLRPQDNIAIVVYAGSAGTVLKPTSGKNKKEILNAIESLGAGGSTAGAAGIELAYELAGENFNKKGNNRVIIATDGDFNIGINSPSALEDLIASKRDTGIFLSVLGYGMGNYSDTTLETLADKGNGNHAYIDSMQEAQKVFMQEFNGTLHTMAKDVKLQIEFNPATVAGYRLIGYENRIMPDEDFVNDKKDAGDLGLGHTVTALYELVPTGVKIDELLIDIPLKYSSTGTVKNSDDLFTVKLRYKTPQGSKSREMTFIQKNKTQTADVDMNFASAVALFGMKLRKSEYGDGVTFKKIKALARKGRGTDNDGYRAEFIRLVDLYASSAIEVTGGSD